MGQRISTNAPLAGGDYSHNAAATSSSHFNQRPPCGGRRKFSLCDPDALPFQPTPPLRGATTALTRSHPLVGISTNAPLAGGDTVRGMYDYLTHISTNAPLAGGDGGRGALRAGAAEFQPTPPLRGATAKTAKILSCFYSKQTILSNIPSLLPCHSKSRVVCSLKTLQNLVRNYGDFLCACASHLEHQHICRVIGCLYPKMLDFVLVTVSQVVKAQTVLFRVHDLTKLRL